MPYGGVADGWETPDRSSVYRVQKLPPANPRGSALVYSDVCKDLRVTSGPGSLVRHGPGQSKSVDPRALARAAGGAARPWRCPCSLPDGPGATTRCLGGRRGHRGRPSRGGPSTPRRRAGVPPFAHDGTERRIVRPQDPAEQQECYSGKKKDHMVKNVLLVHALLTILFLSDTYAGRVHEKRIVEATPYPLPAWLSHAREGLGLQGSWPVQAQAS